MAASTMERAERCRRRAVDFPAVLVPSSFLAQQEGHPWQPAAGENLTAVTGPGIAGHRHNGDGQHVTRPMGTVTGTHEKAALIASTGAIMGAAGNTFERAGSTCRSRGLDQPLWTQPATNSTALVTPPLAVAVDNYQGVPRGADEPLPTQAGSETFGLLTARILPNRTSRSLGESMGPLVGNAGSGGSGVPLRKGPAPVGPCESLPNATSSQTLSMLTADSTQGALFGGWYKQNGSAGEITATAPHPLSDPLGTLTGRDTTALLTAEFCGTTAELMAEWREAVATLRLEDWWYKMLGPHEVGRGCGFDVSFPGYGYQGSFVVWGSAKDQVDGFGNAVSPQVGTWIGRRLRPVLDTPEAFA
jgi:hypothetical protein